MLRYLFLALVIIFFLMVLAFTSMALFSTGEATLNILFIVFIIVFVFTFVLTSCKQPNKNKDLDK